MLNVAQIFTDLPRVASEAQKATHPRNAGVCFDLMEDLELLLA